MVRRLRTGRADLARRTTRRSDLPVQQAVLHGFGDMGFVEAFLAVEVSDRAGEAADLVVGLRAQAHACDRLLEK